MIRGDFGLTTMRPRQRADLLEILVDHVVSGSKAIPGQMPVEQRHGFINDRVLADAIFDRPIHSGHKLQIEGESMRKMKS